MIVGVWKERFSGEMSDAGSPQQCTDVSHRLDVFHTTTTLYILVIVIPISKQSLTGILKSSLDCTLYDI